ncbi:MAG: TIGR03758 family integrating conjugative element protein [Steroidobacteraceae bacterium]
MSADEQTAFLAGSGFQPSACATLLLSAVFVVLLLWGVWAMRTAYVGWVERQISQRQFLAVIMRFIAIYVVLTYFLLS